MPAQTFITGSKDSNSINVIAMMMVRVRGRLCVLNLDGTDKRTCISCTLLFAQTVHSVVQTWMSYVDIS